MLLDKIKKTMSLLWQGKLDKLLDIIAWSTPDWMFFYGHNVLTYTENPCWQVKEYPDHTIRLATMDDIDLLHVPGSDTRVIMDRLRAGDKSLIVLKDGKLQTMIWGATGKLFIRLSGAPFDTADDGCFYYSSYTSEEARGRGLGGTVHQLLHESYASQGRRKNWAVISMNNFGWLQAVLRRNYKIVGETYFLKLLFVNICYYKSWPFPTKRIKFFLKNPPEGLRAV
jgi:hypothetical protein